MQLRTVHRIGAGGRHGPARQVGEPGAARHAAVRGCRSRQRDQAPGITFVAVIRHRPVAQGIHRLIRRIELRTVDGIRAKGAKPPRRNVRDGALRTRAAHADRAGGRRPGERIGPPRDRGARRADGGSSRGARPQRDVVRVGCDRIEPQRHAPRRQRVGIVAYGQRRGARSRRAIAQRDGAWSRGPIGIAQRHRVFTDRRAAATDSHRGEVSCCAISHAANAQGHIAIAPCLRTRAYRNGIRPHGTRFSCDRNGVEPRCLRTRRRRIGGIIAADRDAADGRGARPLTKSGRTQGKGSGLHAYSGAPNCRRSRKPQGGRGIARRRRLKAQDLHAGVAAAIGIASDNVGPQAGSIARSLARRIGYAVGSRRLGRGATIRVVR
ncbi:Uncharacterised protein [Achromobacter aegrifaciens]|uniref:Uncharacterized protein n=1 Tax=Achromobacter aegrifaciens TaxID=1287736 RepID=A0AAD2KMC7_ACHAE|nr:Uncharacterised protein [Achromobacter aegrifaciens]